MLRKLLLLLLLAYTMPRPGTLAQVLTGCVVDAPIITGRVLDAKTRLPVPYATVRLRNGHDGGLANAQGHFELRAPQKPATDTLLVESLGYSPHSISLTGQRLADSTLTLEKTQPTGKTGALIGAKVSLQQVGSRAKKPGEGMIQGVSGSQYALLMQPSGELGDIRTVSFFIGENGFPKEPFRIRIYRPDGPNHSPGTNLLTENVVVEALGGGQWFTVDISNYNVEATSEGFFVAMEWIACAGMCQPNFMDSYTPLGQILSPTFEFKESRTWGYTIGKGWSLLTLANSNGKKYNAMIRAQVEILK